MASRGDVAAEGQEMNAWIREVPMSEMAAQLEIPELPMRQPGFDFYAHALHHLKQMGFAGQELYHAAHEVIQKLFFNIGARAKSREGPIYQYIKWYEKRIAKGFKPQPFDEFFKYAFRQKAFTARKKSLNQKKKKGLSIEYGRGEDEGMVGEDFLEDTGAPSPEEVAAEQEEREKREEVFDKIPQMLKDYRSDDKFVYIWELMKKGYKLEEMADELNALGIPAARGGLWGTGSVHKVRDQIYRLVRAFLEDHGIDWRSIVASRKGFRFELVPEG
jgi:hypothetical protein